MAVVTALPTEPQPLPITYVNVLIDNIELALYEGCGQCDQIKMISLEKWIILISLQKLHKMVEDLGKLDAAKDFE